MQNQAVIQKYGKLLENYRTLRSDYEEEKESRERYKKLSRERVSLTGLFFVFLVYPLIVTSGAQSFRPGIGRWGWLHCMLMIYI
jgi:hypothetical protein